MGLLMKEPTGEVSSGWHNMVLFMFQASYSTLFSTPDWISPALTPALAHWEKPWLSHRIGLIWTLVFWRVDIQVSHTIELVNKSGGDEAKKGKWQQCWVFFCSFVWRSRSRGSLPLADVFWHGRTRTEVVSALQQGDWAQVQTTS